jgi:DNA end-binding protein Ku
MFYDDEIKELQKPYKKPQIAEQELTMAKMLIQTMDTPFDPAAYKDEYQIKLRELIETKISGKEVVSAEAEKPANIINLMDALKASIEQSKKQEPVKQAENEPENEPEAEKPKRTRRAKGA